MTHSFMLEQCFGQEWLAEKISPFLSAADFDLVNSTSTALRRSTVDFATFTAGPGLINEEDTRPAVFSLKNPLDSGIFHSELLGSSVAYLFSQSR